MHAIYPLILLVSMEAQHAFQIMQALHQLQLLDPAE